MYFFMVEWEQPQRIYVYIIAISYISGSRIDIEGKSVNLNSVIGSMITKINTISTAIQIQPASRL